MCNYSQILLINKCVLESRAGLELQRREKYICITLSVGSIFFQLLLPFVFVSSSFFFFFTLPGYDLCAGSSSGTFSAALACGYFRSVAFQVVQSTLPMSDVVALFKRNEVFPAQTRSNALSQEPFINCWTTFFFNACFHSLLKTAGFRRSV